MSDFVAVAIGSVVLFAVAGSAPGQALMARRDADVKAHTDAAGIGLDTIRPRREQEPPHVAIGPNLRLTAGEFNEPWIAASPTDPEFLIAVSQVGAITSAEPERHAATLISRDGGRTWRQIELPGYEAGAFDPMVVSGPDGRMYVLQALIGRNFASIGLGENATRREGTIRIWSTADEGRTWDGPTDLYCPVAPDHPRMVVDRSDGPHRGRLYIVWNNVSDTFIPGQFELFMHYSDDGGGTFSDPILLDARPDGKLVATEPVVLSDGTLLVTYYQYWNPLPDPRNDHLPFFVIRSDDGGETFGEPEMIFEFGPHVWRHLMGEFSRAFSLPIVRADVSPDSPYRDHVYIVWDDVSTGWSDIWLVRSVDGGRSWSRPVQLNDNALQPASGPRDFRMTPTVAINGDGVVGVGWYDRRNDPTRRCWEFYFTASIDGGDTFSPNQPVSTTPSCPPADLAPAIRVNNLAPLVDPNRPSEEELMRLGRIQRLLRHNYEQALEDARREAYGELDRARIWVSFDAGRNIWPGHYTGLAADAEGVFHALWLDRRNGQQELFATRVRVSSTPPVARPATREEDVTALVAVLAGPATYDRENGTVRFHVQLRNVSDRTIYGPIDLRVRGIVEVDGRATVELLNPHRSDGAASVAWSFDGRLGSEDLLAPMDVSEPIEIEVRTLAETGLDGALDVEVVGHLARRGTAIRSQDRERNTHTGASR